MRVNRTLGIRGEQIAVDYLTECGFEIIERNFRFKRMGEIDIIAKLDSQIHFVEVKARSSEAYGLPLEAIDSVKINRIRRVAEVFLYSRAMLDSNVHFDVVSVDLRSSRVQFYKDAF